VIDAGRDCAGSPKNVAEMCATASCAKQKRKKRARHEKGDRSMQTRHAIAERYHLRRKFVKSLHAARFDREGMR
jgi:hypothetical protein